MRLHHIAYVTKNVEEKADSLCTLFGFSKTVGPVVDEKQKVRIIFLDIGSGTQLELLEPLGPDSPVQRHLKKGGGLYHLCLEVDNLDEMLERVQKDGFGFVAKEAVAAPAIGGRRVAFVVTPGMDLVEFVEADKK